MTDFLREKGRALIGNGYLICAVHPGEKRPIGSEWQKHPLTTERLGDFPPGSGVGILCGQGEHPVYALDVDTPDEALYYAFVNRVESARPDLINTKIRVGKAPKALFLYRGEEAGRLKVRSPVYRRNPADTAEPGQAVEVLGAGQQFVAYGVYPTPPGTPERLYTWENEDLDDSPEFCRAEDLPVLRGEDVEEIVRLFCEEAEALGYRTGGSGKANPVAFEEEFDVARPPVPGITIEEAERIVRALEPDLGPGTNDSWVRLGMALHHQFDGSDEALALWDKLSLDFGEAAYKEGECAKRWRSFSDARGGVPVVTFRSYLRAYQQSVAALGDRLDESGLKARYMRRYGPCTVRLAQFRDEWMFFDEELGWWDRRRGEVFTRQSICRLYEVDLLDEIAAASDEIPAGEDPKKAKSPREILNDFRERCLKNSANTLDKVFRLLKADSSFCEGIETFDANPRFFGVANGVLDLDNRVLLPAHPKYRVLRQAGCSFDPNATCPSWDKAILEIFDDNPETVAFFYRVVGSALRGKLADEHFVILRGLGCNGKSLVLNTMAKLFGGYAESLREESLLGRGTGLSTGGEARADLVKLAGARFVYCSETTESNQLRYALVKRMTGRDGFSARAPFGRAEVFIKPTWRLFIATNHPPSVKGDDDAVWRRIVDLECPRNFETDPKVKMDPYLEDKVSAELPGILNRLLEGLADYEARGGDIAAPEGIRRSVREYRDSEDDVKQWFEQAVVYDENAKENGIKPEAMYERFSRFMEKNGEDMRDFNFKQFRRRVLKLIPTQRRRKADSGRGWRCYGYRFRDGFDEEDVLL